MQAVSVVDFAEHLQNYLECALRGEKVVIKLDDDKMLALMPESGTKAKKKKYSKMEMLDRISYHGTASDSQDIDDLLYK